MDLATNRALPATVAVLASFVSLQSVARSLQESGICWGAQDVSAHESGAHTGEIAAAWLAELGCQYVVVGHSERRALGETDEVVRAKALAAQRAGLTPIICVGESLEVREQNRAETFTLKQLEIAIEGLRPPFVIAYEPIWAIGTGKTATPEDATAMGTAMREFLEHQLGTQAQAIPLLYGGSVKPDNIAELCAKPNVDGALVGGASLEIASVMAMLGALEAHPDK